MSVESNFAFVLVLLYYDLWLVSKHRATFLTDEKKLQSQSWLKAGFSPRFGSVTCITFESWLVHCTVYVSFDSHFRVMLGSVYDTQMKTALFMILLIWILVSLRLRRLFSFPPKTHLSSLSRSFLSNEQDAVRAYTWASLYLEYLSMHVSSVFDDRCTIKDSLRV